MQDTLIKWALEVGEVEKMIWGDQDAIQNERSKVANVELSENWKVEAVQQVTLQTRKCSRVVVTTGKTR